MSESSEELLLLLSHWREWYYNVLIKKYMHELLSCSTRKLTSIEQRGSLTLQEGHVSMWHTFSVISYLNVT